jgi:hypothetical protein
MISVQLGENTFFQNSDENHVDSNIKAFTLALTLLLPQIPQQELSPDL